MSLIGRLKRGSYLLKSCITFWLIIWAGNVSPHNWHRKVLILFNSCASFFPQNVTNVINQSPYSSNMILCYLFSFWKQKLPFWERRFEPIEAIRENSLKELWTIIQSVYSKYKMEIEFCNGIIILNSMRPTLKTKNKFWLINYFFVLFNNSWYFLLRVNYSEYLKYIFSNG